VPPAAPARATRAERVVAAGLALGAATVLGIAASLQPSPNGVGTHQALGLAPCSWVASFGMPCPSCGFTTAFSHAAHGSLWAAVRVQPMGALLALLTAATLVVGAFVALTGSRVGHELGARITPRAMLVLACIGLASWGYKIALMRGALPLLEPR
jgi:hypothetical protein